VSYETTDRANIPLLELEDLNSVDKEHFHPEAEFYFDKPAAAKALDFFPRYLSHVKGELARTPLNLQPNQKIWIRDIFGWKRHADATRQYREVGIWEPRKNGKTTVSAGLALFGLHCDGEQGGEIYSAAADREQAGISFDLAASMVKRNQLLRRHTQLYKNSMVNWSTSSSYKVLSKEVASKHGYNAHMVVFDELHAQPNRKLWDVLQTSMASRRQPLMISISTAGDDPLSIAAEKFNLCESIIDRTLQVHDVYPVIYAAPKDVEKTGEWKNPEVWKIANPNLGISVKLDYIKSACEKAQISPAALNTFLQLHLNIWTTQTRRWMTPDLWRTAGDDFTEDELKGRECYAGLDISSRLDLSALVLFFPASKESGKKHAILPFFWCPEDNIKKRSLKDKVPYEVWAREGLITPTPGNIIDQDFIRAKVNELGKRFKFKKIAVDPHDASHLISALGNDGFEMVEFQQGMLSFQSPVKELMTLTVGGRIMHRNNKVLAWNVTNVATKKDAAGNEKPDKEKAREKIDGAVALIMAIGIWMVSPNKKSVYGSRGVLTLD